MSLWFEPRDRVSVFDRPPPPPPPPPHNGEWRAPVAVSTRHGLAIFARPAGVDLHVCTVDEALCNAPATGASPPNRTADGSGSFVTRTGLVPSGHAILGVQCNCVGDLLAVASRSDEQRVTVLTFYTVQQLASQAESAYRAVGAIPVSRDAAPLVCVQFSPADGGAVAFASADGTVGHVRVEPPSTLTLVGHAKLPNGQRPMCLSWSPKGKQLAVGTDAGRIYQLKLDMTVAKCIEPPAQERTFNDCVGVPIGTALMCTSLCWLGTYEFAVVYEHSASGGRPLFTVLTVDKAGAVATAVCYDDVCFGQATPVGRPPTTYFIQHIAPWQSLVCTSTQSVHGGVLCRQPDGGWRVVDDAAEGKAICMPMDEASGDNATPAGVALDYSSKRPFDAGGRPSVLPLLVIVTDGGVACPYYAVVPGGVPVCADQLQPVALAPAAQQAHAVTIAASAVGNVTPIKSNGAGAL